MAAVKAGPQAAKPAKPNQRPPAATTPARPAAGVNPVQQLQQTVGNRQTRALMTAAKAKGQSPGRMPPRGGGETAPGVMELKGAATFAPPPAMADFLATRQRALVNVRFGTLAAGAVEVSQAKGRYRVHEQGIPLVHPLFPGGEALAPELRLAVGGDGAITGAVGLGGRTNLSPLLKKAPDLLGLAGFDLGRLGSLTNALGNGTLRLGLKGVPVRLGGAFSGTVTLEAVNEVVTFAGSATVDVRGLVTGGLELQRAADGVITGKASLGLKLPKNFTGAVTVAWDGRAVTGEGKVVYSGEKFSGEVLLRLMEKGAAARLEAANLAPEGAAVPGGAGKEPAPGGKVDYVVFGEGDLTFAFTEWLNGTAHVIVDPAGNLTVIGKITPQKEFLLFRQKDYNKELFKLEARASYGIPVVGNIFIFAKVSMGAFAKLGPAKFYNIVVEGTYSTDPKKAQNFTIQGSLTISAAAGLQLRGEAGAGLEILAHDIKAGAGVNGLAGIRGYAEATPLIGYREKGAGGEDKRGEFFIRGDLEIAAQPFLGLSGDLFVEIDAPWWSPVPDKRWTWPLGGKEWPIGGSFGVGASVDYVFGSGQAPAIEFKPVEFSADKFMTDLYSDKAQPGAGAKGEQKGKWAEKNSKAAEPPPKGAGKGTVKAGPAAPPPARAKAARGGAKKPGRPVDPNARTASGKTVRELQAEAARRGKKPPAGAPAGTGEKGAATGEKAHDVALPKGLAALEAVTARYAADGASREEVERGVKAVRRKFRVFKSITVIDGGATWDYHYVASEGTQKGPKKKAPGKVPGGSAEQPLDIRWVKPAIAAYPEILLAPVEDVLAKKKALGLKSDDELPLAQLKTIPTAFLAAPLATAQLEGLTIGVTNPIARQIAIGYVFRTGAKVSGNARKDTFNKTVKKHGYNRKDNANPPTDGDHVWEKQLGGPDHESNVWPLNSSINQESGRTILAERKRIKEMFKIDDLAGKWVRLAKTVPKNTGD